MGLLCHRGHDCPLYIESHIADGLGCVDDMMNPCRVMRGEMNFEKAMVRVIKYSKEPEGALAWITPVGHS